MDANRNSVICCLDYIFPPTDLPFSFPLRSSSASRVCSWVWLALRQWFISCSSFSSWLSFVTRLFSCAHLNIPPKITEQLGISTHLHHGSSQRAIRLCKRACVLLRVQHSTADAATCANRKEKIIIMMPTTRGGKWNSYSTELNHLINVCCAFLSHDMSNWLQGKLRLPSKLSAHNPPPASLVVPKKADKVT